MQRPQRPAAAAPARRPPPTIQRAAPSAPPPNQAERRNQRIQKRQQAIQQRQKTSPTPPQAAQPQQRAQQRIQQLRQQSENGKLNRAQRRELRQLRRTERQQTQNPQQAVQPNAQRLRELQTQRQRGQLSREERRELRQLRRADRQQATQRDPQRLRELQAQRQRGQLSRAEQRELRQLQRAGRVQNPQRQRQLSEEVARSRFAARFDARRDRRDSRRGWRLAARAAWRLGAVASYVPWHGGVYWPYAYNDIFFYTFWPSAYEPAYWAYAYDDFFDGIFFPYGAPYVEYAYAGPYDDARAPRTTGTARSRVDRSDTSAEARVNREFCAHQADGITAWPFEQIERAVQPNDEQRRLLEDLKKASASAAERFKDACPDAVPMTPPSRLEVMVMRLQATKDAVAAVRPAMEAFYQALSDEQKARFNEIGPDLAKARNPARTAAQQRPQNGDCGDQKAGFANLPVDQIEDIVQPTAEQADALDRLDEALQKAVDTLSAACPTETPMTPVGRLEAMEKRLDAMIEAANTVRPPLEDFYAVLSAEQKARFNRMGRATASR